MSDPRDRRKSERFPVNSNTSCPFVSPVVENFGPVKIKNISNDGIGLIVTRKIEPGGLLAVTLTNQSKNFSKIYMVRIVHVTAEPGAFLVGGTFVTPLSYEELSTLVL